jgi:hypothetical protein
LIFTSSEYFFLKENETFYYIATVEEWRHCIPLIDSLLRSNGWNGWKNWFMRDCNLFALRAMEGHTNFLACLNLWRTSCGLGDTVDEAFCSRTLFVIHVFVPLAVAFADSLFLEHLFRPVLGDGVLLSVVYWVSTHPVQSAAWVPRPLPLMACACRRGLCVAPIQVGAVPCGIRKPSCRSDLPGGVKFVGSSCRPTPASPSQWRRTVLFP